MSQPKLTGPSLLDPSSLRGRTFREVLCGSSRVEGIVCGGAKGSLNGTPDGISELDSRRRWNVVKSVAGSASRDNLAEELTCGYGSRGDQIAFGNSKGRVQVGFELEHQEITG